MRKQFLVIAACLVAEAALAHGGVKNMAVMDRMNGMSAIAENMKTLGQMAKGVTAFDAASAQAATDDIAKHASEITALFEAQETDPKSEALPAIWERFDDFSAKANALEATASGLSIQSQADLGPALGALGQTCKSCHSQYRQ